MARYGIRIMGLLGGATALAAACGPDATAVAPGSGTVRFQVTNALLAPVTVSVDGTPVVILGTGRTSPVTVPSSAHSLTWVSAKPTDAAGVPIPDDIGEVTMRVSGIGNALEIDNVIGGLPHVTASIVNRTTAQVSIGVFDGATVSCAAVLPGAAEGAPGFVRTGYYRLGAATELRAYRAARCTGPFTAWPRTQLTSFAAKAGLVVLSLDVAP
ncbi:MAG: hypothetical protein JO180_11440 [Gemmatirosa sp.]|nr:hypothetical protein [Gemmatirosa sp.]